MADFCLQNNVKIVNISSGCIYDGSEIYTEEDEQRMEIVGQNGNDGIHYDDTDESDVNIESVGRGGIFGK